MKPPSVFAFSLTAILILLGSVVPVAAAEWFVSPRGDDSAAGTSPDEALATVARGVSRLKAGDTLTLLPGEYLESVELRRVLGTKDAPLTIRAQRPGTALLRGDREVEGWEADADRPGVFSVPFEAGAEGVADPRAMRHYEPAANLADLAGKPGSFHRDATANRLIVRTPDARPPGLLRVSVTNGNGIGLEGCAHITIEGLVFTGYAHADTSVQFGSRTRWGVIANRSESIALRGCVAYLNSGGFCLSGGTSDSIVEECEAFGNASRTIGIANQILGWGAKDCVFRGNRITGYNSPTGSQDQIAFYSNAGQPNSLEDNIALHASFMDKGDATNVRVSRNLTTGPKPGFYRPEDASNLRVQFTDPARLQDRFADPVNGDFRLLPDSPLRGQGLDGADPGPHPFREEVFFVSPEGDDGSDGLTPAKPWRTLQHAATMAKPGDTIYVLPGVYHESLAPARSGTAEQPIRFARRGDGRVVLDGQGKLDTGIRIANLGNIAVEGLTLRNFIAHGVAASGCAELTLSHLVIEDVGGDGVSASRVQGLTMRHCSLDRIGGSSVRLGQSSATLTGIVFGSANEPRLVCDTAQELWSDRNLFVPGAAPLARVGDRRFASLADWQGESGLDPRSLSTEPGLAERVPGGGLRLRDDSPLPGRGPLAAAIGPFRRLESQEPVAVTGARLHSATATTANLECETPSASVAVSLQWSESGSPAVVRQTPVTDVVHRFSLTGLKPGVAHEARFASTAKERRLVFATDREALVVPTSGATDAATVAFTTPVQASPPRTLHVAPDGDDSRDGLSPQTAWRTINHAASRAVAGDTVLVHSGTYEETVTVRGSGDEGVPITFRPAPGAVVWLTGSGRLRSTAFSLRDKHHIVLDGFRFRDFLSEESSLKSVVTISGGSHVVVRRCFYDGRVPSGYMNVFLGMSDCPDALVENCVMILGMGEGMSLSTCPRTSVRHCVFYNNNIRALSIMSAVTGSRHDPVTVTHNLFCAAIPSKGGSAFIRTRQLHNLVSDHNVYFDRIPEERRSVVETMFIGDQKVGQPRPGSYDGEDFALARMRAETGQETHSRFGNPGLPVVKQLSPRYDKDTPENNERSWQALWLANELHQTRSVIDPLDFPHFFADPGGPLAKAADGKPIGLDPAAFGSDFALATDRGE